MWHPLDPKLAGRKNCVSADLSFAHKRHKAPARRSLGAQQGSTPLADQQPPHAVNLKNGLFYLFLSPVMRQRSMSHCSSIITKHYTRINKQFLIKVTVCAMDGSTGASPRLLRLPQLWAPAAQMAAAVLLDSVQACTGI